MAGLCMIVNVIIESENKQIPHVSKQQKKQKTKKTNMYNLSSTIKEEMEYM